MRDDLGFRDVLSAGFRNLGGVGYRDLGFRDVGFRGFRFNLGSKPEAPNQCA